MILYKLCWATKMVNIINREFYEIMALCIAQAAIQYPISMKQLLIYKYSECTSYCYIINSKSNAYHKPWL